MDTHLLKLYERYKSEYDLYEGLITSYPLHQVKNIFERKGYNISTDFNNNTFKVQYIFSNNIETALKQHDQLIKIANTCGYFCSDISGKGNDNVDFKKYTVQDFSRFIKNELVSMIFSFEAKYDIPVNTIPESLYHLTPSNAVSKILKYGLVPRSRSKKAFHPERIYLAYNIEDITLLFTEFYKITRNKSWTILKINTNFLPYLEIYQDPNFLGKGVFSLNTISPISLTIEITLEF